MAVKAVYLQVVNGHLAWLQNGEEKHQSQPTLAKCNECVLLFLRTKKKEIHPQSSPQDGIAEKIETIIQY